MIWRLIERLSNSPIGPLIDWFCRTHNSPEFCRPAFGPYGHHTEDSSSPKIAAKDASPSISSNSNGANSSTASNIVVKEEIEVVASTPRDNSALKPVAISR